MGREELRRFLFIPIFERYHENAKTLLFKLMFVTIYFADFGIGRHL